jgi:redox-sensitive bicupin YhaK (pirin superfamily)
LHCAIIAWALEKRGKLPHKGIMNKTVLGCYPAPQGHWVGDGFPVRSLFDYNRFGARVSPFLLLDYAGPVAFEPAARPRGVGEHPHRGFETVTIVYQGEVAHRDSVGNSGVIGPGDVQWMTAAGGILHEEFHSPTFTRAGGTLEMMQLWVNLPAAHKMAAPRYQTIVNAAIPELALPGEAGRLRVIAGSHEGTLGPASTFSELNVWDLRMKADKIASLSVPAGHIALVVVMRGAVRVNGSREAGAAELVMLGTDGLAVQLQAAADSTVLVLTGVPIDEPIVGYGPFVMNSRAEIETAMSDFQRGRFGSLQSTERGDARIHAQ